MDSSMTFLETFMMFDVQIPSYLKSSTSASANNRSSFNALVISSSRLRRSSD